MSGSDVKNELHHPRQTVRSQGPLLNEVYNNPDGHHILPLPSMSRFRRETSSSQESLGLFIQDHQAPVNPIISPWVAPGRAHKRSALRLAAPAWTLARSPSTPVKLVTVSEPAATVIDAKTQESPKKPMSVRSLLT